MAFSIVSNDCQSIAEFNQKLYFQKVPHLDQTGLRTQELTVNEV